MNVPRDSQQSTAFAQAAATSEGAWAKAVLWLILTEEVVPGA
ncbi:MAG: hypothetical protein K0S14_2709 [Thermomicrobiales bacterium]|jgi:hypothetical protein|nr:hypothetical protein [Thermomicrobiales bacterium]MCD6057974.1 hypothetical protein [Thermomicrobiales bacterium]MDF3015895.1 hypothetical protein [Thermomicrobiales bacterium]